MTAMPRDFSVFVRATPDGLAAMDLAVEGMHCAACMKAIERGLSAEPGVVAARSNLSSRRVHVEWRPAETDAASVLDRMAAIGFRAHPFRLGGMEDAEAREEKRLLLSLAVAGFAAMNIMLLSVSVWAGHASSDLTPETRDFFHWLSGMIALPAALYAGRPFFESAFKALRARRVNMDVPISLGVLLALGLSVAETLRSAEHAYFDSAVMLLFFLLVGRVLERIMRRKTRALAANLAALRAETACKLVSDTETRIVPVAALVAGDRIRVLPGERIPADGVVAEGHSAVDASLVTGETRPAEIGPGSAVHAGTLNLTGLLTLAVEKAGEGTLLAEVEDLFHRATEIRNRRSSTRRLCIWRQRSPFWAGSQPEPAGIRRCSWRSRC